MSGFAKTWHYPERIEIQFIAEHERHDLVLHMYTDTLMTELQIVMLTYFHWHASFLLPYEFMTVHYGVQSSFGQYMGNTMKARCFCHTEYN